MDGSRSSPMLEQYRRIKKEQTGNILFFRLGDFYEMFADDAVEVSSLLNLTLTSRNGLPMCGVPYHAARSYIARLLKLGKKIAICEQLTAPEKQKVIDRDVVEIITPGTTVDEDFLDKGSSNYLCCLAAAENALSFSYIDLSTGDFFATSFKKGETEILRQELERLQIKEMLIQESLLEEENQLAAAVYDRSGLVLNRWADWLFDPVKARDRLEKQFGLANLKSFGLDEKNAEIISAGTLLDYLDSTAKKLLLHIRTLKVYRESEYMGIDESSQRNLELLANQRDGDVRFSLLEVMDETRCSMGRRLLKRRLLHPLRDLKKINARLDIVENLYRDQGRLSKLRELLGKTPDLERLCSRLAMDKAHGRDMLAIKNSLVSFHAITELITENLKNMHFENDENWDIASSGALLEIQNLLDRGLCDEPSILLNEGNLIKSGYSEELDGLKLLKDKGRQFLEEYLEEEREITGIINLKIKYNRLIGYFFEVTNTHLASVPKHFIRRQGIAGGERYTTDRLAALESDINGASDKLIELEKKLFIEIREQAKKVLPYLACAAGRIAELDAAQSLAKAASIRSWTRPVLNESKNLEIIEGRHPVVEAHLGRGEYIPNDIILHTEKKDGISFIMITGPNMAGKSTYLRSAALITIMAQSGSFVPASEANIGLCDRIYCRVGASDNLARGESTFLVEMNETAFILNTATEKSLVIMDEVGRGTGTNDGLSIAWAVSEELLNRIKCRTLFATHFHELSLLSHPNLVNRSMEVQDNDGKIVFLRKLKEGPAAESYGIHVAKLAGLNDTVLERASLIMGLLKERDSDLTETFHNEKIFQYKEDVVNRKNIAVNNKKLSNKPSDGFFVRQGKIEKLLHEIEPEQMTPLEALNLLCQWKKILNAGNSGDQKQAEKKQKYINKDTDSLPSLFD
jgi:DNA mismatch repair protein MutS